ncbi:f-box only protein [Anaeramoeba ignava]|uniref:F-box only protein n=1 Tax=Anaeramoeba ignava TaxID=1746090 RepID=A0A9Q0LJF5_ANAIG|nr:f-box only protein [Anaeramoeba ignava]
MEQFTIQKFGDKLKAKITNDNFNFLKIGEMSEVPTKLKKPPKQENLFIEMLPEDVHLYIFQFLSPGSLLKLSMTCQTFNDLSKDINCWRNMSFKYWRYFLLNDLEMQNNFYYYGNSKEDQIPIYGIIEEPKIINSNLQSIMDKKPQKLIQRQSSISLMFNRLKNLREKKEEDQNYIFPENDYKSYMMRYIQSIPNPGNELISKSKLINQKIKERKNRFEEFKKNQMEINRRILIFQKIDTWIDIDIQVFKFCILTFLILLGFYIDTNLSFNPFYFFILLLIPTLILPILFLFRSFYDTQNNKKLYFIVSLITFVIFIQVLLIGLKSGKIIQYSWLFRKIFRYFLFVILSLMTFLFIIVLEMKLDGKIGLSDFKVFFLLFFIGFFSIFFWAISKTQHMIRGVKLVFGFIFMLYLVPFTIFEILIFCYLQFSGFEYISFTFIPLYLFLCCQPFPSHKDFQDLDYY